MTAAPTLPSRTRTCNELGVCQGRSVHCLDCDRADAPPWSPDEVTCTPFETMWSWIVISGLTILTVIAMAGAAGYLFTKYHPTTTDTAMTIVSRESIIQEATRLAAIYTDVNDACRYPFDTDHGRLFKQAFYTERARIDQQKQAQAIATTAQAATKGVAP